MLLSLLLLLVSSWSFPNTARQRVCRSRRIPTYLRQSSESNKSLRPTAGTKISNVALWLDWSSDSLEKHGGLSLYEALNQFLWQEIDSSKSDAVISHGYEKDSVFCYANQAAQSAFGYNEAEMYCRSVRNLVSDTHRQQVNENFWIIREGIGQRKNGSRFLFRNAWLWNVYNPETNQLVGQTAVYFTKDFVEIADEYDDDESNGKDDDDWGVLLDNYGTADDEDDEDDEEFYDDEDDEEFYDD